MKKRYLIPFLTILLTLSACSPQNNGATERQMKKLTRNIAFEPSIQNALVGCRKETMEHNSTTRKKVGTKGNNARFRSRHPIHDPSLKV
ncbi:hypothetical protein C8P63_103217 [Melghirimyces profundicolus]|uniref:Uncharacterized protein n=1 Tax=Melghirimyces profundicolus TaxID=1242148 RepID=A0A2T6C7Y2_9BACL|nr:hypothetical protein [Melghirimyces profundicolus]PTX64431.1 hypothetical protein C8P63_103217 [Melghirimyces profundicolus]